MKTRIIKNGNGVFFVQIKDWCFWRYAMIRIDIRFDYFVKREFSSLELAEEYIIELAWEREFDKKDRALEVAREERQEGQVK